MGEKRGPTAESLKHQLEVAVRNYQKEVVKADIPYKPHPRTTERIADPFKGGMGPTPEEFKKLKGATKQAIIGGQPGFVERPASKVVRELERVKGKIAINARGGLRGNPKTGAPGMLGLWDDIMSNN